MERIKLDMSPPIGKSAADFICCSTDVSLHWMRFLVELGSLLQSLEGPELITAAVCLPRVEYAGLLVAAGACLRMALFPKQTDWRSELGRLFGKRIVYSYLGNPYVCWEGILHESEQGSSRLKIQLTTVGYFDLPNFADVHSIRLDWECQGMELGDGIHGKEAYGDAQSLRLASLLQKSAVGELCCSGHKVTLVGSKARIGDELSEALPFGSNNPEQCSFADLLRPSDWVADAAVLHVLSPHEAVEARLTGVVVIEGSRRLSEVLGVTKTSHRVILLGRNESQYSDNADTVSKVWQQRDGDFELDGFVPPEHMKVRMFY